MTDRPVKHSLTLRGHRTSVSLEEPFWAAFKAIADRKSVAVNALAADVDERRGARLGLASAIRIYVLEDLQSQVASAASS